MGVVDLALAGGLALACLVLIVALLRLRAAERRYRTFIDNLPQTVLTVFDQDLNVRFLGGGGANAAGLVAEEIEGRFVLGCIPQVQREPLLAHYRAALRGEQRSFEYREVATGRDYSVRVVPFADDRGRIHGGMSLAIEAPGHTNADGSMPTQAGAVDAATDATRALARTVDPATARNAVCEGARKVAGAPVAALLEPAQGGSALVVRASAGVEIEGLELPLVGDAGAGLAFTRAEEVFITLGEREAQSDLEFMRRTRARAVLWHPVVREQVAIGVLAIAWHEPVAGVSLRLSSLIDLLGAEAAVAIGRADLLGQLEHLARTDSLTGLPNRRYWEQQLPRELARAAREEQGMCVAMLDLDHFKAFNDRRGHQAGDRMLAESAVAWRAALRPYDILSRYGGEEFSVILPGCRLPDAVALVERLRMYTPGDETCSAGVAEWDGAETPTALVGRADRALYTAKRAGRDRVIAAPSS